MSDEKKYVEKNPRLSRELIDMVYKVYNKKTGFFWGLRPGGDVFLDIEIAYAVAFRQNVRDGVEDWASIGFLLFPQIPCGRKLDKMRCLNPVGHPGNHVAFEPKWPKKEKAPR